MQFEMSLGRKKSWPACDYVSRSTLHLLESDSGAPPQLAWRRKLNSHANILTEFNVTFREAVKMIKLGFRLWTYIQAERSQGRAAPIDPFTRQIKPSACHGVPLGGMGSGSIGRGFRGEFRRWQLIPGACEEAPILANQFSVFISREEGKKKFSSVLYPGRPPELGTIDDTGISSWDWNLDGQHSTYHAVFPRAWTIYEGEPDPEIKISCRQISPFIPNNYRESCLPACVFAYTLVNTGRSCAHVTLLFTWANSIGGSSHLSGGHFNESFIEDDGVSGALLHHKTAKGHAPITLAVAARQTNDVNVSICPCFTISGKDGDFSAKDMWSEIKEHGAFHDKHINTFPTTMSSSGGSIGAAVAASIVLQPHEKKQVTFSVAWDSPKVSFSKGRSYYRRYTKFYGFSGKAATRLAHDAIVDFPKWESAISRWQDPILRDTSLPEWYRFTLFNELYYLVAGGTVWAENEMGEKLLKSSLKKAQTGNYLVQTSTAVEEHEPMQMVGPTDRAAETAPPLDGHDPGKMVSGVHMDDNMASSLGEEGHAACMVLSDRETDETLSENPHVVHISNNMASTMGEGHAASKVLLDREIDETSTENPQLESKPDLGSSSEMDVQKLSLIKPEGIAFTLQKPAGIRMDDFLAQTALAMEMEEAATEVFLDNKPEEAPSENLKKESKAELAGPPETNAQEVSLNKQEAAAFTVPNSDRNKDDHKLLENGEDDNVGRFLYLEGLEYVMWCTYDVHFYASFALLALFPKLELSIQLEFAAATLTHNPERTKFLTEADWGIRKVLGAVPHDLGMHDPWIEVNAYNIHDTSRWKDLNAKFVLQVYRDFIATEDMVFAEKTWPAVCTAMAYMDKFDRDRDGLVENDGFPDQTYDTWTVHGVSAYCGGLWLGALQAAAAMAERLNQNDAARSFREKFYRARDAYEKKLWNGSYFNYDSGMSSNSNSIQADQLAGQWYAYASGLSALFEEEKIRSSLAKIFEFNVLKVKGGKLGAVNGMHPNGKVDETCMQSREIWTGVTYAVAATMIHAGLIQKAFSTAEGIFHAGWSEEGFGYWFQTPEGWTVNGHYRSLAYMRPLAIWAMQWALSFPSSRINVPKNPTMDKSCASFPQFGFSAVTDALGKVQKPKLDNCLKCLCLHDCMCSKCCGGHNSR